MNELHNLSACELLALYQQRVVSPVEVTQAVLAHIEAWEPRLQACYALDPEAALAAARQSEQRWMRGEPVGALDGVPTMLKENIATRGVPVPLGTAATELVPAAQDAPPAARLREAGVVLLGKTTMPDYGMLSSGLSSFHPLTRNPWDLSKNPGGSSSGSAAAAAAGYGPLHLGTDIGGSIRLPAGWCGLFGLKPSLGRIPIDPPYPARVAGPLTRTVADAALMMGPLSRPDPRDHMSLPYQAIEWQQLARDLKGLRLGLLMDAGWGTPVQPEVRDAVLAAARAFEAAGAIVEPVSPWAERRMIEGVDLFWRTRFHIEMRKLPPERRERVLPFIRAWADGGAGQSGEAMYEGYSQTLHLRAVTVAATQPYDYVLSPTAPMAAFAAELPCPTNDVTRPFDHIAFTLAYNMSEQPAASINCGYTREGLPIGLQIAGRRFDDLGVLQMAHAWEQMRPAQRPWPTVPR
ncbi:amidase [Caldimonas brevitalea]|uniref:Amidase n=1 Tax=Caldimonas brevitalea TaxID=413882 RepID=A0A0G3BRH3_9BURK|nr:amidase [Caldimonas brevitalea]AKJ32029.1 amidase [Caldimonas brevitalea]